MEVLTRPAQLAEFIDQARTGELVALDMEFERERTYRPILQLVQLATRERAVVVDPLEIRDLSPLWDLVADPEIPILFHAGVEIVLQDLEVCDQILCILAG